MGSYDKLRAFIRYANTGRVIPGSLILRNKRPRGKDWVEVDINECCPTTTTTTTTEAPTTTTTTTL